MDRANQTLMVYITTKNARNTLDNTVLVFNDVRLTFKAFDDRICRLANGKKIYIPKARRLRWGINSSPRK